MKYVIEFEDEPFGRNDDPVIPHGMDELYRAKGFSTLVFDRPGLDKLTPLDDELKKAYDNGYKDGADAADTESEIYRKRSDSTQKAIAKIMNVTPHAVSGQRSCPGSVRPAEHKLKRAAVPRVPFLYGRELVAC